MFCYLRKRIFERGALEQLLERILLPVGLPVVELDFLAQLADHGPEAAVLVGERRLHPLIRGLLGQFVDDLLDQLLPGLLVGDVFAILRTVVRFHQRGRVAFRVHDLCLRGVVRFRCLLVAVRAGRLLLLFLLLALLGAVLLGLQGLDHLLHLRPLPPLLLQVGAEHLHRGLAGRVDHLGVHRLPPRVHELQRRQDVRQLEPLELPAAGAHAVVQGVPGEPVFHLPLELDRHGPVEEPARDLLRPLPHGLLLSLGCHIASLLFYFNDYDCSFFYPLI